MHKILQLDRRSPFYILYKFFFSAFTIRCNPTSVSNISASVSNLPVTSGIATCSLPELKVSRMGLFNLILKFADGSCSITCPTGKSGLGFFSETDNADCTDLVCQLRSGDRSV